MNDDDDVPPYEELFPPETTVDVLARLRARPRVVETPLAPYRDRLDAQLERIAEPKYLELEIRLRSFEEDLARKAGIAPPKKLSWLPRADFDHWANLEARLDAAETLVGTLLK